ncbi:hypothetical protein ACX3V1_12585 [Escherichia coli]
MVTSTTASIERIPQPVSYTHLRAHETSQDLVCRRLLEKGGRCLVGSEMCIRDSCSAGSTPRS